MSYSAAIMPERAPLKMQSQRFDRVATPRTCIGPPPLQGRVHWIWRVAAFVPTLLVTIAICISVTHYFGQGGVSIVEGAAVGLIAVSTVWLVFAATSALLGMVSFATRLTRKSHRVAPSQNIALLMPIYNETPWSVFGNAAAMLRALRGKKGDRFTLFLLSDTRDAGIARLEERAFAALAAEAAPETRVYYRRRHTNTDKKVGNIADWIENWGAAYGAMLVLDADSLMSGQAIQQLADALADDPDAGLIQSRPVLIGAETLFGRIQQFSNSVYGWLIAEGVASWSQDEGNYWGHNAIIRTRAFAESARLPHLRGLRGQQKLFLSHDFIEAGMLRRAGWRVRLLPRMGGSYEETPQTLIDYALRDRRWCLGNMQHLRILAARGFHPISRLHLVQGALSFLMSPVWFAALIIWAFIGMGNEISVTYFSPTNPLTPIWPDAQSDTIGWFFLLFIYGMLLLPKLIGAAMFGMRARTRIAYGSGRLYVGSICVELVLSVLYAPITMVQHTLATLYALLGWSHGWSPQNRGTAGYSWGQALRFHWIETLLGVLILSGLALGQISALILPIAISLAGAVPLSILSAWPVAKTPSRMLRMDTPHSLQEPAIVALARIERARMKSVLTGPDPSSIAAE